MAKGDLSPEAQQTLDALSEKTYYRIGEVAKITRVKPYVLRFWETEFNVISPPRSRSKQRMYRKRDIETILLIKQLLYKEGFTSKGARKRLTELSRSRSKDGAERQPEERPPVDLKRIRSELEAIREILIS